MPEFAVFLSLVLDVWEAREVQNAAVARLEVIPGADDVLGCVYGLAGDVFCTHVHELIISQ